MEELVEMLESSSITFNPTEVFRNEINYICSYIISYYQQYNIIYTDILQLLCHWGHDLAYDLSDDFEKDKKWFKLYGQSYIGEIITSNITLKTLEDYQNLIIVYNNIKNIYEI
jgi:hypothetical protein